MVLIYICFFCFACWAWYLLSEFVDLLIVLPSTRVGHDSRRDVRPFKKIWWRKRTVSELRKMEFTSSWLSGGRFDDAAILKGRRKHDTRTCGRHERKKRKKTSTRLIDKVEKFSAFYWFFWFWHPERIMDGNQRDQYYIQLGLKLPQVARDTPPRLRPSKRPSCYAFSCSQHAATWCIPRQFASTDVDTASLERSSELS